jgi:hypothetical protein
MKLLLSNNITGSLFLTGGHPVDIIEIQKQTSGGQNQTKLNDYTLAQLRRRINVENNR